MTAARRSLGPVLVLGGYGAFGGQVAERLAADGFAVEVAGRDLARASAFCAGRPGLTPRRLDRDRDLPAYLAEHRPWAVVDASGPFQGQDYAVPRACIAAACHYVDIADGRAFVVEIAALNDAARAAGVAVIAGASSLPAVSGAVARHLALGLDRVSAVAITLSASNRGLVGRSVMEAVLSYVGRPFALWRHRRWETVRGWEGLRRRDFHVAGHPPLRGRLVGHADVPDLVLLPDRLPGRPSVTFHAGAEQGWQNRALQLLGWLVRWGLWRRPLALAGLGHAVLRRTQRIGGLRSAMDVALAGWRDGRRVERRWTLLAEQGSGPVMPTLAVPLILAHLAEGRVAPGARDAGEALDMADFVPVWAGLPIVHASEEVELGPPLYARVMGARFADLPPLVREMHSMCRDGGAAGMADVERGRGWLAGLAAWVFGMPPAGRQIPVHVGFTEDAAGRLLWRRDFGGRRFHSHAYAAGGRFVERFGPFRFAFDLEIMPDGLAMRPAGWSLGPVPLPRRLGPTGVAREWEADGRFHFDAPIRLPLIGLIVRYRGWLRPL